MKQLCFNKDFSKIIEIDINKYWKDENDIPQELLNYIKEKSDLIPIYTFTNGNYYCQKCFHKLKKMICNNCSTNYNNKSDALIFADEIENIKEAEEEFYYYCFDTTNNDVILYIVKEKINFNNPFFNEPYKTRKLSLIKTFNIKKEGLLDLTKDKEKMYKFNSDEFKELINNNFGEPGYVYINNLDKLKNTIYKYTNIWKAKKYLYNYSVNIENITKIPLNCKAFEYCMKNETYCLGFTMENDEISFEKKYLKFIKKSDISIYYYKILLLCDICDINFIKNLEEVAFAKRLYNKKINYNKIKEYFDKNNISYKHLFEYFDYLEFAEKLGFNIKDKKVLYPKNLKKEHDKLMNQYTIVSNKINDKKIKELSKILEINNYEDNNYIIYPAHSVEELIEESKMQNNCVQTYIEDYSENKTHIYLMRKKENKNKSFVTIEEKDGKVLQARLKNNENITSEIKLILKKWEKDLIKVQ